MPTNTPVRAAVEPLGHEPGVLERLPVDLEQQPLLRVHALGLARRDPEEARVEAIDVRRGIRRALGPGARAPGARAGNGPTASPPRSRATRRRRAPGLPETGAEAYDGDRLAFVVRTDAHGLEVLSVRVN